MSDRNEKNIIEWIIILSIMIVILSLLILLFLNNIKLLIEEYNLTPREALGTTSCEDSVTVATKYLGISYCCSRNGRYYIEWNNKCYDVLRVYHKIKEQNG